MTWPARLYTLWSARLVTAMAGLCVTSTTAEAVCAGRAAPLGPVAVSVEVLRIEPALRSA